MKIKFLKELDKYKAGDAENVTDANAEELIKAGYAAPLVSIEQQSEAGSHMEDEDRAGKMAEAIAKAVKDGFDSIKAEQKKQADTTGADAPQFKSMGHFAQDVARVFNQDTPSKAFSEYVKTVGSDEMSRNPGSEGGFVVPEEFQATLLEKAMETAIVRPRATLIPMAAPSVTIPYVNETSRASTLKGGINIAKRAEKGQLTASKPALGKLRLSLNSSGAICYVTNELLEDSAISLGPVLQRQFVESINFEQDYDFLTSGTGAGEPLSILNAPCKVSVSAETNQAADTIVYENIIAMWSQLYPSCMANAVWIVNNDTLPQLMTMSIAVGTGGIPVYLPGNSASNAPFGTLLGRPVIVTEKAQELGTEGDIILADLTQYAVGVKVGNAGPKVESSMHLRFDYNEMAYRFIERVDGQPLWSAAITPREGANDLSCFVTLASRT